MLQGQQGSCPATRTVRRSREWAKLYATYVVPHYSPRKVSPIGTLAFAFKLLSPAKMCNRLGNKKQGHISTLHPQTVPKRTDEPIHGANTYGLYCGTPKGLGASMATAGPVHPGTPGPNASTKKDPRVNLGYTPLAHQQHVDTAKISPTSTPNEIDQYGKESKHKKALKGKRRQH